MIFVLDTGNTNTVLGVFKHDKLIHEWRIRTDIRKTEDEYGMLIKSLFEDRGIAFSDFKGIDRKSTRLNSSHVAISYAVFCLKKKKKHYIQCYAYLSIT